jgi:hypothetical protein
MEVKTDYIYRSFSGSVHQVPAQRNIRKQPWDRQPAKVSLDRDVEHMMAPSVLMTVSPIKFAVRRETKWEQSIRRTGLLLALSTRPRGTTIHCKSIWPWQFTITRTSCARQSLADKQHAVYTTQSLHVFVLLMATTLARKPGSSV